MSFFDQPYYALTKAHMCRIGLWPEQSKNARFIRLMTAFVLAMTIAAPRLTRFNEIWRETDALIHDVPLLLTGAGMIGIVSRLIQHFDEIKLAFDNIEKHWEMFKDTSAVVVLDDYTERGRRLSAVCSKGIYIMLLIDWSLCLSPIILDAIEPLNDTRSKVYMFHTEYGVDKDKYYFFVLAHEYIVSMVASVTVVTVIVVYVTWAVHACALFEVVGFNFMLITSKYTTNKENEITRRNDEHYGKMCDCIAAHEMAISFAELIERICSGPFVTSLFFLSVMIVFTGVQALINSKHRSLLVQSACFILCQILVLYVISMPGQELMNHSEKINTIAYDLEWSDMSVKAQKLLIPIMIRSNRPCRFTARKVYVLSMESFSSVIHLYINSIPGQELINHSEKIHTIAYNLEWHDMSVNAQKLLIPIMIRSNEPCGLTARKVYVLSMESFGSTIRTVMSYFTIFAQMMM